MILKIIDNQLLSKGLNALQIVFERSGETESYDLNDFESPFRPSFLDRLDWYFHQYLLEENASNEGHQLSEKMLKFGQHLGDSLVDDDSTIYRIVKSIEELGYANLNVHIVSDRSEFLAIPWEALVLPDSNYVLSAVAKSFCRISAEQVSNDLAELHFDLHTTSKMPEEIQQLKNELSEGISDDATSPEDENPLNILHVIYAPGDELTLEPSPAINLFREMFGGEGAVNYLIQPFGAYEDLKKILECSATTPHILHFETALFEANESLYFGPHFSENLSQAISADQITALLQQYNIPLLCLDLKCSDGQEQATSLRLAKLAKTAALAGVGNLIGLSNRTNACTSALIFKTLYLSIVSGLNVGQAVTETRKKLQAITSSADFFPESRPFQCWTLLNHYIGQPLSYFRCHQPVVAVEDSQHLVELRRQMHGFNETLFQYQDSITAHPAVLRILSLLTRKTVVNLSAGQGEGKTHSLHQLAMYLVHSNVVRYGFYFDFDRDFYDREAVMEMVAPIFGLNPTVSAELSDHLNSRPCLFIFENLDASAQSSISDLLAELVEGGHTVLTSCRDQAVNIQHVEIVNIEIGTLPRMLQQSIACQIAISADIGTQGDNFQWGNLLSALKNNPFLIKHVVPMLKDQSADTLQEDLQQHFNENDAGGSGPYRSLVDRYFEWQWQSLSEQACSLLWLLKDCDGLVLEMLLIACEPSRNFDPAQKLIARLAIDQPKTNIADILSEWSRGHFSRPIAYGNIFDRQALFWLKHQINPHLDELLCNENRLLVSQVICEAIRLLALHVTTQQGHPMLHHLLMNRRHWVKHFERLWFGQEYRLFLEVKRGVDTLMASAKLSKEVEDWAADLLARTPAISIADDSDMASKVAWLEVASLALQSDLSSSDPQHDANVECWRAWVETQQGSISKSQLPLLHQAVNYLKIYYLKHDLNDECIVLLDDAQVLFKRQEVWAWFIETVKVLVLIFTKINDLKKAMIYEEKILSEVPYDDAPPGLQSRHMIDIAFARVARGEHDSAQVIIEQIRVRDDAAGLSETIDAIQADIHYQKEQYPDAMPYYCRLWERALNHQQTIILDQLKNSMLQMEEKLGSERFSELFSTHTDNCIPPAVYSCTN